MTLPAVQARVSLLVKTNTAKKEDKAILFVFARGGASRYAGTAARRDPVWAGDEPSAEAHIRRLQKEGAVSLLDNAPLRPLSDPRDLSRLSDRVLIRCLALSFAGKALSEHATSNFLVPFFKGLSRASDAVHLLGLFEDRGAHSAVVSAVRDALAYVEWDETDPSSLAFLIPDGHPAKIVPNGCLSW